MLRPHEQLERELGEWAGYPAQNVVACSSGTAALHLALEALQLPPGSEVLVPDFTMIACPRAVTLAGLTPVFVDCGEDLLIDFEGVKTGYFSPATGAVMPVAIYGRKVGAKLFEKAEQYGVKIVEDLAEAHGVRPRPDTDAACWSFYRNKIVAGEEGGAVAFEDPYHADVARMLRSLGFTEAHDFTHRPRGCNYRLADSLASLILSSLERFGANLAWRRDAEAVYDAECPGGWRMSPRDAPWTYDLRLRGCKPGDVDRAVAALKAEGVEARHGFKPCQNQEEYRGCRLVADCAPSRSYVAAREVLYLPLRPGLTWSDARRAFDIIRRVVGTPSDRGGNPPGFAPTAPGGPNPGRGTAGGQERS
jgi:perosamine synthetase